MKSLSVDRLAVRRFLLSIQHLLPEQRAVGKTSSPETVLTMIRQLECVQLDPVSVVERNQHLVLAARIPGYQPEHLDLLLSDGMLFEYIANAACAIPIEDYPIFKPVRDRIQEKVRDPLEKLDQVVQQIEARLRAEGPLPSRVFQSENRVHGYWDNEVAKTKETSYALNLLLDAGRIRVVQREGTERFFDLPESTISEKLLHQANTIDMNEARHALIEKYIRAYRIFDARDPRFGWQKLTAVERRTEVERLIHEGKVVPLQLENVEQQYYMQMEDVETLLEIERNLRKHNISSEESPIQFLAPLDNLLWRRERLTDFFDFHYRWEIYTPRSKRRFGAYAMPILCGDRLIGRMDPQMDRKKGRLNIRLLQIEPDVAWTPRLRKKMNDALQSFAQFHKAQDFTVEQTEPEGLSI